MTPVSRAVFQHPLHEKMFVIFEPHHASLIVRDSDSYGLVIEQRVQGTRTGRIQYGNDQQGYALYVQLLKFLIATNQKIPKMERSPNEVPHPYVKDIKDTLVDYEIIQPYPASHQMDMNSTGTISPSTWGHHEKGFIMSQDGHPPVFFSGQTIPFLVDVIHRVYAHNSVFRKINEIMRDPRMRKRVKKLHFTPVRPVFKKPAKNTRERTPQERLKRIQERLTRIQERLQPGGGAFPEGPETRQYRKKPEKGRVLGRLRLRKRGR